MTLLFILAFTLAAGSAGVAAQEVRLREETVQSAAMQRAMRYRVLLPDGYAASQRRYPVLYLLHGLTGNYTDWTTRTNLAEYSRSLPLIIVMPDGENGWYTNSAEGQYETYILTDLQADVVSKYRTLNSRYGRAVAGLSMGGYGALKMALKRPGAFAVAGSFSGAFNVTREGELERLIAAGEAQRLGRIFGAAGSETRKENDLVLLASATKAAGAPYLYVDCGTSDNSLIAGNRDVVAALHRSGAAYEYHEVAGGHTWDYWDRRIREFLPILMKKLAND
ncbi:MAG TPA: alpha/beta hydrolase family protein [Vicinamibacterales bacterium]|nr:alpha/beta hydrolase family protein [Vicinamibacterales bacterium]